MGKNAIVGQSGGPTSVINASLAVLLPSSMQALQAYLKAARVAAQRSFTVCAMALPVCWRSGWWIFPPC